jgi:beta-mannanase
MFGLQSGGLDRMSQSEAYLDKRAAINSWSEEPGKPVPGVGISLTRQHGTIPMIEWRPPGSLRSIAAGAQDSYIRQYGNVLCTQDVTVMVRLWPEMNDGRYFKDGSTPADLVNAFNRTARLLKEGLDPNDENCDRIQTVWNPVYTVKKAHPWQNNEELASMWPGDQYVDFVGIDVYDRCTDTKWCPGAAYRYRPALQAIRKLTDKPVILPEVGTGVVRASGREPVSSKAQWLAELMRDAKQDGIKAVVYYDKKDTSEHGKKANFPDWRLSVDPQGLDQMRATLNQPSILGGGNLTHLEQVARAG